MYNSRIVYLGFIISKFKTNIFYFIPTKKFFWDKLLRDIILVKCDPTYTWLNSKMLDYFFLGKGSMKNGRVADDCWVKYNE